MRLSWLSGLSIFAIALAAHADGRPVPTPASMPVTADRVSGMLQDVDKEEEVTERRLDAIRAESERLDALVIARGRAYVRRARAGLLPVSGGFGAFVDHAARLERLRRALARDLGRQAVLARRRRILAENLGRLRERRDMLGTERAALARSHTAILAAEERERAFRQAFMSDWQPNHTAVYASGPGPIDPQELQAGFASMKGRLPFPVAGRAEIASAERPATGGVGVEIGAIGGTSAQAVFPGRVAFADAYADYGKTVIIDHGSGYFSVTAGLGVVAVRPGDEVGAGDLLGRVGSGDGSLYFELRHGQDTLDPSPWFGI